LLCVLPSWLKPNAADYGSEHQGLVQQPRDYASLRWNDGEFHNIFLGKTRLRTFLYTNMLLEVWANPALGIRALFLRGAPSGEAPGATSAFVETRGGAKKKMHFVKDLTEKTSDFCRWMSCASIASALWLASGYAKDVSGSSDHPALSRIAGSTIVVYERKDQAEIRIPLERVIFDLQTQKFNAFKTNLSFRSINSHTVRASGWEHSAGRCGILRERVAPSQWRGPLFRCAESTR
jgi:hypothetical protein